MEMTDLERLFHTVADVAAALTALALADPEQAELVAIVNGAVAALRASNCLTVAPTDDNAALHTWRHTIVGQLALLITAAELLLGDTDLALPEAARPLAEQLYAVAQQMNALVEHHMAVYGRC